MAMLVEANKRMFCPSGLEVDMCAFLKAVSDPGKERFKKLLTLVSGLKNATAMLLL